MSEGAERKMSECYQVLIVNEDAAAREMLAELLQAPNRSIHVSDSPRAALEFLQQNPLDVAFIGATMNGMNGSELADRLKTRFPQAHVVICSSFPSEPIDSGSQNSRETRNQGRIYSFGEMLALADSCSKE